MKLATPARLQVLCAFLTAASAVYGYRHGNAGWPVAAAGAPFLLVSAWVNAFVSAMASDDH
jgi:hypothetical protein